MVSPNDEQAGLFQDVCQEVMIASELRSKLVQWIDGRIDVSSKPFLCRRESVHDILERRVPNDEEINVAVRTKFTARSRAEHERDLNLIAKRREPFSEQVDEAGRL
jgi:hypothetical protein